MGTNANTVKKNIEHLVDEYPESKHNYNLLVVNYWRKFEGLKSFADVHYCTPSESITRAFRSLVRSGRILIDPRVKRERRRQEKDFIVHYHQERI